MPMPRGIFLAVHLAIDVGLGRQPLQALAVVDDLYLQGIGPRRKHHAH